MTIEPMGPVIVGVDGSLASLHAVDLAAADAAVRATPLVVVHAAADESDLAGPRARAQRLLAVATARAHAEHAGLSIEGRAVSGEPVDVLVDASRAACLLVIGHRRGGGPASTAGATAAQLVGRMSTPLLVHRVGDGSETRPPVRPILVGVCDGAGIDAVLAFAFEEAALRGVPLTALYVRSNRERIGPIPDLAPVAVREAFATWAAKHPTVHASHLVRYGMDVPLPLVAESRRAQLVVVGGSSTRRADSTGSTSVSGLLVRQAHCPVVVVPAPI
jgi:nucleotide-binding universal stress UspA family protein